MARLTTRHVRDRREVAEHFDRLAPLYRDEHGPAERLLAYRLRIIRRLLAGTRRGTLLEIGCGTAIHLLPLAGEFERAVGTDLSAEMIRAARRSAEASPVARPGRAAGRPGRRAGDRRGPVGRRRPLRRRPRAHARPRAGAAPGAPGPRPRRHLRLPHPQRRLCLVSVPRPAARPRHPSPVDRPLPHRRRTGGAGRRRRPDRPSAGVLALHPTGRFAVWLGSHPGGTRPSRDAPSESTRSEAAWRSRPTGLGERAWSVQQLRHDKGITARAPSLVSIAFGRPSGAKHESSHDATSDSLDCLPSCLGSAFSWIRDGRLRYRDAIALEQLSEFSGNIHYVTSDRLTSEVAWTTDPKTRMMFLLLIACRCCSKVPLQTPAIEWLLRRRSIWCTPRYGGSWTASNLCRPG